MRVLSLLTYYDPHWTGLTAHARKFATGLAARGHAVSVLAHQHEPGLPREEVREGVRVHRTPPLARISRGMVSPAFLARAIQLVREHDVVAVHTPMLEALPVALACRALGRPLVVIHHGDLVMPAGAANRAVERVTNASIVGAFRLATRVTSYSDDYAENSPYLLPMRRKLTVVPPPVEIPPPDLRAARAWRAGLGLADKQVVGFAGRFVEEKGGDVLLRALPLLHATHPNAHVLIAAETHVAYEDFFGKCRPLLAEVEAHVTLLGLVRNRDALARFYAACDVLALPSRTDCFALVQPEAMLCGTPVVASDIPGARIPVRETGMGRLVRPEDPAALAEGLRTVLAEPERHARPAGEIAARFAPERTVDAYASVLADAVARRTPVPAPGADIAAATRPPLACFEPADRDVLEDALRNETDMAYRRRLLLLLGYLELKDGDRVLDAGCGMGFPLHVMSRLRDLRLAGIDVDASRLAEARQHGVAAGLSRTDLTSLPFATGAFDKVMLSEVLEHVRDDRAALAEAYRVLRPGGVLAISVPHAQFPFLWDPIHKAWSAVGGRPLRTSPLAGMWSGHLRLYWPEDLARKVGESGFAVECVEEATHHAFPGNHFLVYGIGKPLLERGLLPERVLAGADRFRGGDGPENGPLRWARRALHSVDRRNERPRARPRRTFVNVLVKARKP